MPTLPATPLHRRPPRRRRRDLRLAKKVEDMLVQLEELDRRAPLPAAFVAELEALHRAARRPLARAWANLAIEPFAGGPVTPGTAVVVLLKLRLTMQHAIAAGRPAP
ncbi:MAG: hypothetical protein P4M09_08050 [Devosia sp.]|nr:hypothetical protein [Devosia sp.]